MGGLAPSAIIGSRKTETRQEKKQREKEQKEKTRTQETNRDCVLSHQQFPVLSEEGYEYPLLGVAAGPTLPSFAITGSHKPETRQEKKQKEKKQKEKKQKEKKQKEETKRDCVLSRQRSPVLSEEGYEFPLLGAAAGPTLPSFAITGSRKPETRQEKKIKEKKQKEKKQKEKKQKEETKRDCVLSRQRSPVLSEEGYEFPLLG